MGNFVKADTLLPSSQVFRPKLLASSGQLSGKDVEQFLAAYTDVVDPRWTSRHAKLVYSVGTHAYSVMADKARTKRSPRGYMAYLVSLRLDGAR
jgi:hypothetical protein